MTNHPNRATKSPIDDVNLIGDAVEFTAVARNAGCLGARIYVRR